MSATLEKLVEQGDPLAIPRDALQRHLLKATVAIDDDDLAKLTDDQAEILWDWMESYPADSPDQFHDWMGILPTFMEDGEDRDGIRHILLGLDSSIGREEPSTEPGCETKLEGAETTTAEEKPPTISDHQHLELIKEINDQAVNLRGRLMECESEERAAKARTKEARENLDKVEIELSQVISDAKSGQQRLDFGEVGSSEASPAATANETTASESHPIAELGSKSLKSIVGAEAFDLAKSQEDPIGFSDSQLEKFEQVDVKTVEQLEKFIRDDEWWHRKIKGFGDVLIQRTVSTLVAYRKARPVVEGQS